MAPHAYFTSAPTLKDFHPIEGGGIVSFELELAGNPCLILMSVLSREWSAGLGATSTEVSFTLYARTSCCSDDFLTAGGELFTAEEEAVLESRADAHCAACGMPASLPLDRAFSQTTMHCEALDEDRQCYAAAEPLKLWGVDPLLSAITPPEVFHSELAEFFRGFVKGTALEAKAEQCLAQVERGTD